MFKSVVLRFAKGFVAGGLASVTVLVSSGIKANDLKGLLLMLLSAFVTGGLLAVEKAYNWQP